MISPFRYTARFRYTAPFRYTARFLYRVSAALGCFLVGLALLGCSPTESPTSEETNDQQIAERTSDDPTVSPSDDAASENTVTPPEEPTPPPTLFDSQGRYAVLEVQPRQVHLVWKDDNDEPLRQLEAARQQVEGSGQKVLAVMNAGIYTPSLAPAGLHIEQGQELSPINLRDGEGNFQLLPNGVFYINGDTANVTESNVFEELRNDQGLSPELAVQSGPQLLIDRKIHPEFSATSTSKFLRNGVGVTESGQLLFLNANEPVSLWEFANEFRNMGAVNALYLDGSISRMDPVVPERAVPLNIPFAAMIVITE